MALPMLSSLKYAVMPDWGNILTPSKFIGGLLLVLQLLPSGSSCQTVVGVHEIKANHPAFEQIHAAPFQLVETEVNEKRIFRLDVQSVICADHQCKVVPVSLFWDALGKYVKYELVPGDYLEKGEGVPFTKDDYQTLQTILLDENSPYGDLTYHEVTHDQVIGEGQVDGISGATTILLANGQTVIGATWSCFTLWHWANGDVVGEVRRISGARATVSALRQLLDSGNQAKQHYALSELNRREQYDPELVESVLRLSAHAQGELLSLSLSFLEGLDPGQYLMAMVRLYDTERSGLRQEVLKSLLRAKSKPGERTVVRLIGLLPENPAFQEVDYLLRLIEQAKVASEAVSRELVPLLKANDFLLSRRVYYFLSREENSAGIRVALDGFYALHKDNL